MKSIIEPVVLILLIWGNLSSLRAGDVFPRGKMADGNFVPGTVLIYDHGQWLPTEKENAVDPTKYTFVIIHGAHCSLRAEVISQLAEALTEKRPEANILAVDWSAWSSVGTAQIVNWSFAISRSLFGQKTGDEDTLMNIFAEIIRNAIPVEQARYIPEVTTRLTWKLFGKRGKKGTFTTLDPATNKEIRTKMTALGLDPQKIHLIGHSHGAHVAGLTGMFVREKELGKLDWISALDPSTNLVHDYPENFMGTGWDASAARLMAVFLTTYFFSSEKEATNDSLFYDWRDPNHPINHPKSGLKIFDWLKDVLDAELQNHRDVFRKFTKLIRQTDYLDEVFKSPIPQEKEGAGASTNGSESDEEMIEE